MSDHLNTPWTYSDMGQKVFGKDGEGGDVLIADVRGWGYLTGQGTGALGLSHEEATAIQDKRGKLLAAAPDLLKALRLMLGVFDEGQGVLWGGVHEKAVSDAYSAIAKAEVR